ncbi:MAG: preprotein translocase subunit YajC [Longicatena sp.]
MINWEVILWCFITIGFMLICFLIIYYIVSAKSIKKRRTDLVGTLDSLKPGKDVLFAGGIKGKILKVGEEYLEIEVAKGVELTVNKLSVSQVLKKGKSVPSKTK